MADTLSRRDDRAHQTSAALFLTLIVDTQDGRSATHKLYIEAAAVDDTWTWTTWRMAPRGRVPIAVTQGGAPEDDLLTRFLWLIGRLDDAPEAGTELSAAAPPARIPRVRREWLAPESARLVEQEPTSSG